MIRAQGGAAILVRGDTSPEDIGGMHSSEGILTQRGGMWPHARTHTHAHTHTHSRTHTHARARTHTHTHSRAQNSANFGAKPAYFAC